MAVTKNQKFFHNTDTQQWLESEIATGDILDVFNALNHPAQTVVVETGSGEVIVSFNVVQTVRKTHYGLGNGGNFANPYSPVGSVETEEARPEILLSANSVYVWDHEFSVFDIKIVQKSTGMKVLVS